MQTIMPSDFKRGMVLLIEGSPHVIVELHTTGTAKFKQKLHARLRHLTSGRVLDRTFAEHEHVPEAELENRHVQYSYKQTDTYVFLDTETYEQLELADQQVGERRWFLKENEEYKALFLEGGLVDIVLPAHVVLEVVETGPVQRGGSDSTWKPATLETGLEVMVPLFIGTGEQIRVETNERKYAGRHVADRKG